MSKYSSFDKTSGRVIGWYDTDFIVYPNLDISELVEVSDDIWSNRLDNTYIVANGVVSLFVPPPKAQPELISEAKATLAAIRYTHEIAGVSFTPAGASAPVMVASDRDSQSKLIAAYVLASGGHWQDGTAWKMADGTFVPLTSTDAVTMALTVQRYVSQCFANELNLATQLSSTTDAAGIATIDLTTGWPANG